VHYVGWPFIFRFEGSGHIDFGFSSGRFWYASSTSRVVVVVVVVEIVSVTANNV
jgi:hypothetical protein